MDLRIRSRQVAIDRAREERGNGGIGRSLDATPNNPPAQSRAYQNGFEAIRLVTGAEF